MHRVGLIVNTIAHIICHIIQKEIIVYFFYIIPYNITVIVTLNSFPKYLHKNYF